MERIAHEVAHDIRNQYTIAYTPTNTALDGTYRQIKVVVKAPGNPWRARGAAITPQRNSKLRQKPSEGSPVVIGRHSRRLATDEGLPAPAVAQPLSALAD